MKKSATTEKYSWIFDDGKYLLRDGRLFEVGYLAHIMSNWAWVQTAKDISLPGAVLKSIVSKMDSLNFATNDAEIEV